MVALKHRNSSIPDTQIILKKGGDLRKDMYTQVAFYFFNTIWSNAPFLEEDRPYIYQYRVFPLLVNQKDDELFSCIEFVPNSSSTEKFNWKLILDYDIKTRRELHRSAAGGYIASWVLGVRDRHRDNMMMKDQKIFFHIDFEHILNQRTRGNDAPRIAIHNKMKSQLEKVNEWNDFVDLCAEAFSVLRTHTGIITSLISLLFAPIVNGNVEIVRRYITTSLMLSMPFDKGEENIRGHVRSGTSGVRIYIKNTLHTAGQTRSITNRENGVTRRITLKNSDSEDERSVTTTVDVETKRSTSVGNMIRRDDDEKSGNSARPKNQIIKKVSNIESESESEKTKREKYIAGLGARDQQSSRKSFDDKSILKIKTLPGGSKQSIQVPTKVTPKSAKKEENTEVIPTRPAVAPPELYPNDRLRSGSASDNSLRLEPKSEIILKKKKSSVFSAEESITKQHSSEAVYSPSVLIAEKLSPRSKKKAKRRSEDLTKKAKSSSRSSKAPLLEKKVSEEPDQVGQELPPCASQSIVNSTEPLLNPIVPTLVVEEINKT
uniref:PI3K/PI4K catalytic domain-containing protein n=1 Tax=Arcella intermedia TaxID=1963864 RepID=A0A6B2L158_9EUKA